MSAKSPGEKRRRAAKRERERLAYEAAMKALREKGASCATCKHRGSRQFAEAVCELTSDFYGYSKVKMTGLCPDYKQR